MKKILFALILTVFLSGCGQKIPQTGEDVRNLGDMLAYLGDTTETEVTGVSMDISSAVRVPDPMAVSEEDRDRLLAMLEDMRFTTERNTLYEYGGFAYAVQLHLTDGNTVSFAADTEYLTINKEIRNPEGKWEYAEYRLFPDDPADTQAFLTAVQQIWYDAYAIPAGETRTTAELLGEEILDARQVILRYDPDDDNDRNEIRLYVNTADHPELFRALSGLTVEQYTIPAADIEAEYPTFEIVFHIGEEDYRFGKHFPTDEFTLCHNRVGGIYPVPGGSVGYRVLEDVPGAFALWLEEWIFTHREDEGVKIARWEED